MPPSRTVRERLGDPGAISAAGTLRRLEAEGDVLRDRQMREDGIVLENHADIALVRRNSIEPRLPARLMLPAVRSAKPAMDRSRVVFPQPLGPRSVKNSFRLDREGHAVEGAHARRRTASWRLSPLDSSSSPRAALCLACFTA